MFLDLIIHEPKGSYIYGATSAYKFDGNYILIPIFGLRIISY